MKKKPSGLNETEIKPESWLLEEYKLLSSHYFHEDSQLERTTALFTSINGILLTFLGSGFSVQNKISLVFIPLVGIIISIFWFLIHIRVRECRNYNEKRILEIEKQLHQIWGNLDFMPLDIRSYKSWHTYKTNYKLKPLNSIYRAIRNLPSSYSELILPISFVIIWITIILIKHR